MSDLIRDMPYTIDHKVGHLSLNQWCRYVEILSNLLHTSAASKSKGRMEKSLLFNLHRGGEERKIGK